MLFIHEETPALTGVFLFSKYERAELFVLSLLVGAKRGDARFFYTETQKMVLYLLFLRCKLLMLSKERRDFMLTQRELMQLEDFLSSEQNCVKTYNYLANSIQDNQCKQLFQQFAQKGQQHFQTISKHLNAGQNLQ